VNVWLFFITYIFTLGLAFPTLNIAMNSLHSRILGPRRQVTVNVCASTDPISGNDAGHSSGVREHGADDRPS
jgi:hypothetical protein